MSLVAACATAGSGADDDGDDDGDTSQIDSGVVNLVDGGPDTPDAAPMSCDLVTQAGCMPGQACDLGDMNTPECREITAAGTETATCTGATTCAAGYSCINTGGGASCMKYCSNDSGCTGTGSLCLITLVDGMQNPIPGVTLCTQSCDLISASGCPTGWGCHFYQEQAGAMRYFTSCDTAGAGGQGATCTNGDSDCQAGFTCFCTDMACTPANNKCFKTCNATDNVGCVGGTSCQGIGVVLGGKEWGGCV